MRTFTGVTAWFLVVLRVGGGSSMGYKLAGYNVIGCNEIDHRMMYAYCRNHNPKFPFLEPIQEFKNRKDLPPELFNLDILDGSPPCTSFSIASTERESGWGKKKRFFEGQAEQVLDTLFFDFIELADRLKPKVVVAENVSGILMGNAKPYVRRIYEAFDNAGYYVQHFHLNAMNMGVPQHRKRVFFIALRKDLAKPFLRQVDLFTELPYIDMTFDEEPIPFKEVCDHSGREISSKMMRIYWDMRQPGDADMSRAATEYNNKPTGGFNQQYVYPDEVCKVLVPRETSLVLFDEPRYLGRTELCRVGTFPQDYDFSGVRPNLIAGMSVPPVMMAQIASRIWEQWLSKIKDNE